MTDGENNAGVEPDQFARDYAALPAPCAPSTPTRFSSARAARTRWPSIATLTGGALFDATSTSLQTIFKQIRGYQ